MEWEETACKPEDAVKMDPELKLFKEKPDTDLFVKLEGIRKDGTEGVLYYVGIVEGGKLLNKAVLSDYHTDEESMFALAEHTGYSRLDISMQKVKGTAVEKAGVRNVWAIGQYPGTFMAYRRWMNRICTFMDLTEVRIVILDLDGKDTFFVMPTWFQEKFAKTVAEVIYRKSDGRYL